MTSNIFVDKDGTEYTPEEAIQNLMGKFTRLQSIVEFQEAEIALLINRLTYLETKLIPND